MESGQWKVISQVAKRRLESEDSEHMKGSLRSEGYKGVNALKKKSDFLLGRYVFL